MLALSDVFNFADSYYSWTVCPTPCATLKGKGWALESREPGGLPAGLALDTSLESFLYPYKPALESLPGKIIMKMTSPKVS